MDQQARKLGEGVNSARDRLGETIGAIAERADVSGLKHSLETKAAAVSDASARVTDRLPDGDTVRRGLQNPVVLTVGLLAAGVLAGLVAPLSAYERRTLGPIGSEVARRASEAREEVLEQSKAVLAETATAARESAERHGQDLANHLGVAAGVDARTSA